MAQTKYLGYLVNESGHRLVIQSGTYKYPKQTKTLTMTVRFRRLYAAVFTPIQRHTGATGSAIIGGYIPYVSTTIYTAKGITGYKLNVLRRTGKPSGLTFSYALIGV
jgi:hypothetical protein